MTATRAWVALGSNLGDRHAYLSLARERLAALPSTVLRAASAIESTEPLGGLTQPPYLNQIKRKSQRLKSSHIPLPRMPPFFLMSRPPPRSTLFPYTTLFRSLPRAPRRLGDRIDRAARRAHPAALPQPDGRPRHRARSARADRRLSAHRSGSGPGAAGALGLAHARPRPGALR